MKKIIEKILKIKPFKVLLCVIENIIKAFSVSLWKKIENKVFNVYNFDKSNIEYYKLVYLKFKNLISEYWYELKWKKLLELWPGWFLWVWAFLKNDLLEQYYVIDDINHFEKIDKKTIELYNEISDNFIVDSIFNSDYLKLLNYSNNKINIWESKLDIVFSNAVYEHIKNPLESIKELSRITKKWWIWVHEIDFRDHIFNQKSLFFKKIPNFLFNLLFWNCWAWVNRLDYNDFIKIFEDNWFEIIKTVDYKYWDSDYIYASVFYVKKI